MVWNPIVGCSEVSRGCLHCYAKRMCKRFGWPWEPTFHPSRLEEPLHWNKPSRIFVCSMADLFHKDVSVIWIEKIFSIMVKAKWHQFLILTKRPEEAEKISGWIKNIPNLWLGVSVEDQKTADERIPILLQIPAAKRFISFEPLLEGIGEVDFNGIHWAIIGGETGPNARPMEYDWAFSLSEQCEDAGIPFFYKYGPNDEGKVCKMPRLKGIVWDQIPDGN